ncbi:MAG: DUF4276 family protein [bacterium]
MTPRLHVTAEGPTEERYVNSVLVDYLGGFQVVTDVRSVKTGRKHGVDYRGGMTNYQKARQDIVNWMKEDQKPDAFFTTMFDLYGLPDDFPGYAVARRESDPYRRVAVLEAAFKQDFDHPRFLPYVQLHEFEALLLTDPQKLALEYLDLDHDRAIQRLVKMMSGQNPELINDGPETAPSKRIIREIPAYEHQKTSAGPTVAKNIGIPNLKGKCRHFSEWLGQLERLAETLVQ